MCFRLGARSAEGHSRSGRTRNDADAFFPILRQIVEEFSRDIPIDRVSTLDSHIRTMRAAPRISLFMTGALAIMTTFLAAIGCIGLLSSVINEGRRDIAIRMALGCSAARLVRQIVVSTAVPTVVGIVGGLYLARLLTNQFVTSQLFEPDPVDPYAFVLVPVGFAALGLLASYVPARAAASTDPVIALRSQ